MTAEPKRRVTRRASRGEWVGLSLAGGGAVFALIGSAIADQLMKDFNLGVGVIAAAIFVVGGIATIGVTWARRARSVRSSGGQLCLGCLHPLVGLPEAGSCPECGEPFVMTEVRKYWRVEYPSLFRRPDACEEDH